jgi:neutral ceramidase
MLGRPLQMLLVIFGLLLSGCSYTIRVPGYSLHQPAPATRFVAGVGKAELTPPPGIPLGGHGPAGRIARGYWTRLYARAFYFQDSDTNVLTLVSCDLFMIPAGLRAKVLEIVNRVHRLEDASLIISATHTHHSPANFASAPLYNAFAGPLPNFEPKLFEFLASQIAEAINRAITDARTAPQALHSIEVYKGAAVQIQRNRAIAPFFRNPVAVRDSIVTKAKSLGTMCPDGTVTGCPRYHAVDPTLIVVRLVRNGASHGLLTFYAVHPTAMTHDAELYSGDLAGIAMLALENGGHGVSGFFNGAEGDVSPDWLLQDRDDVVHIGQRLATAVNMLLATTPLRRTDSPTLQTRWSTVPYNASCGTVTFAKKPLAGAAELGGAEDGRTVFYNYGWRPEARKGPDTADDVKEPGLDRPLADALTSLDGDGLAGVVRFLRPTGFVSAKDFPQEVPVAVARIGDVLDLAAVPTEVTTAAGRSMLAAVTDGGGRPVAVVGLANEYIGYTTTREEYQLQQYEGASTLLGPHEAEMMVCLLQGANTVAAMEEVPERTFRAGPKRKHTFGPDTLLVRRPRNMLDEDLEPLIPRRLRRLEARIPRFEWSEERGEDWRVPQRSVSMVTRQTGTSAWQEIDNDRGVNFLTVLADGGPPGREDKKFRRYAALWLPPENSPVSNEYAFRVLTPNGGVICSVSFRLSGTNSEIAPVTPILPALCEVQ